MTTYQEELKQWILKGHGRAFQMVYDHLEESKEVLLWACAHPISLDLQSTGTHGEYLFKMILLYPDRSDFFKAILSVDAYSKDSDLFWLNVDLLSLMVKLGNQDAVARLNGFMDVLSEDIIAHKGKVFPFYLLGDFEQLCLALSYDYDSFKKMASQVMSLVRDHYMLLEDIDWVFLSKEHYILPYPRDTIDEKLYDYVKEFRLSKEQDDDRKYTPELEEAPLSEVKAAIRRIEEGKEKMMGFHDLSLYYHPCIREYCFDKVDDPEFLRLLPALIHSSRREDTPFIMEKLSNLSVAFENEDEWHPVVSAITYTPYLDLKLLLWVYENSYCAHCREEVVLDMIERSIIPDDIIDECSYDASERTRRAAFNL